MTTAERGPGELPMCLSADLEGSFERLMQAYQDRLYSFALRLSGNPQDAEEIVQDAFVRAYRALQGYPAGRIQALALRPWLYQISLNVFRNRVRGKHLTVVAIEDEGEDRRGSRGRPAPSAIVRRPLRCRRSCATSSPPRWRRSPRAIGRPWCCASSRA